VDFAFARSIVVVRSEITWKKTGKTTTETRYYLSNAEPGEHTAEQWHALVRGHWAGVEIRNHWRRDALWGEDRSRTRNAHALANLALLRNALLALLPDHFGAASLKHLHEQLHSRPAACLRILHSS
jgi:predicted transposase YbfD/YdcC